MRIDIEQGQLVALQDGVEIPVNRDTAHVRLLNGEVVPYPTGREAEYLSEKRQEVGVSVVDVAACMGVSKQSVHQWEAGGARPEVMLKMMNLYTYHKEDIEMMSAMTKEVGVSEAIAP